MSETTKYASVTAIIGGGVPKPAIPRWVGKEVAKAALPYIVDPSKPFPVDGGEAEHRADLSEEQVVHWLKEAPWRERDRAADLGSLVHRYVECHNLGKPTPAWPLPVRPFMEQFDGFVADHSVIFEAAEMKVYSRQFGYAGTLDAICTIGGRRGLLDIKTGKSGIYPEVALQLVAYARADFCIADPDHPGARQITPGRGRRWYEWHGASEDELPLPEIECAWALHLRPDTFALIPVRIDDEVFEAFLCAMAVDDYVQRVGRGVLGKPVAPEMAQILPLAQTTGGK